MNLIQTRINTLRQRMAQENIDLYLVLSTDPHLNEYIPQFYQIRQFLSGFSGSAATLIITQTKAFLWTDGRYIIQAQKELQNSGIELKIQDTNHSFLKWLKELNPAKKLNLATDFRLLPLALKQELNLKFISLKHKDFITKLWKDRPCLKQNPIFEHDKKFAYPSRSQKLKMIRRKMQELKVENHLISSLDDIAWITNLRGSDIEFNPIFYAYLLLSENENFLFTNLSKIELQLQKKLIKEGFILKEYNEIYSYLENLHHTTLLIDSTKMTAFLIKKIHKSVQILDHTLPSTLIKACKNPKEIANIEQAMIQDGIALCEFFVWLEDKINKKEALNELDIDTQITAFRAKNSLYISNSFATIAGFNANSAMPHYKASENNFSKITGKGLLLIDSGAQYQNGTTDITRVVKINEASAEQIRDYTLVLKTHINIAKTVFPKDIAMPLLDSITRSVLWKEHLDFAHGTGHGVGYFLNVHEGPHNLSYHSAINEKNRAKEGVLISIEPGIYRANQWGIRLENLVLICKANKAKTTEFGEFLYFKPLTLCPFELDCIDFNLLNEEEKQWLNAYHQEVYEKISPYLKPKISQWLKQKTRPI